MRDTREVKASGLQGEASSIIEIIDDDINMFDDRASNTTITDSGGQRWIAPVAAAVLIAFMGYGVISSSSSSGVPKVAPPTTNFEFVTTVPAPTTTVVPPPVPYYAADPPREFSVSYADFQKLDERFFGNENYQLWSTDGSSSSSGTWFSIESNPASVSQLAISTDAYRVQSGDESIAISHTPAGQSVAHFTIHQAMSVRLTAFGWSDEDLVRLAQSITVDGGSVSLSDPSLTAGYQMISAVPPWLALQGIPLEQITYESTDDISGGINISVSPRLASGAGGSTLDRQIALKYFLDQPKSFDVDGHIATAGAVNGTPDFSVATWIAGDHIVTLTSAMPAQQLITIAQTVHPVSLDVWNGMKFQATKHNADNNFGNSDQTPRVSVSSGTDAESQPWTIQVSLVKYPHEQLVTWSWDDSGGPGIGSRAETTPTIHTVVDDKRTYVLADLPRGIAPGAQLQITRSGLDPVLVPFADTDPSIDRTFAGYAFSEPTPYVAQIVGADGTVLATWPSS